MSLFPVSICLSSISREEHIEKKLLHSEEVEAEGGHIHV